MLKRKVAQHKYYLSNTTRLKTKSEIWHTLHPEYNKQYYHNNKERINAIRREKRQRQSKAVSER